MKYRNCLGDVSGRLYVADKTNNRILIFNNAVNKSNGANANTVLGQLNYTDKRGSVAINRINSGLRSSLAIDSNNGWLWHSDRNNNRTLRFSASIPLTFIPTGSGGDERLFRENNINIARNKLIIDLNKDFKLFPNPFFQELNYEIPNGETINSIQIFDNLGRQVEANLSKQENGQIVLSWLPSGNYLIMIETQSMVYKKLVIKI